MQLEEQKPAATRSAVSARLQQDLASAERSGAVITPTFFINGRRYPGPWDESSLAEAMLGTLGHRIHATSLNFARWAASSGLLLLLTSVAAVVAANSPAGPAFDAWWKKSFGFHFGSKSLTMSLTDWVHHGLLGVFFLVGGLIVLFGDRAAVELRVFLTAAVIIDDLVAIAVIGVFYPETIHLQYLVAALALTGLTLAFDDGRAPLPPP